MISPLELGYLRAVEVGAGGSVTVGPGGPGGPGDGVAWPARAVPTVTIIAGAVYRFSLVSVT